MRRFRWFFFGPSATTLYWRGVSTSWFDANNWSRSSGGPADGWVPRTIDNVVFDAGGVGNCTLTADVSVASFLMYADAYTGTMDWANFNMTCGGTFRYMCAASATTRWANIGNLTIAGNGELEIYCLDTNPLHVYINAGVTIANASQRWVHYKNGFHLPAGSAVSNMIIAPRRSQANDPVDIDPSITLPSSVDIRFYTSWQNITQKGFKTQGYVYLNYVTSLSVTQTGHVECGTMIIHGGSGSVTEASSPIWDCGGYNLTVNSDLQLGAFALNGYPGKIKFGTGTHSIGRDLKGYGSQTWGYIDWGTASVTVTRDVDLRYVTSVGTNGSTITLDKSTSAKVYCGATSINDIIVAKSAGTTTFQDAFVGRDITWQNAGSLTFAANVTGRSLFVTGSGTIDLGTGTITLSGDYNTYGMNSGTFTYNQATLDLTSGGSIVLGAWSSARMIRHLRVRGTTNQTGGYSFFVLTTFTLDAGAVYRINNSPYLECNGNVTIAGTVERVTTGYLAWQPTGTYTFQFTGAGTVTCSFTIQLSYTGAGIPVLAAGTYAAPTFSITTTTSTPDRTLRLGAGTFTFTGNVYVYGGVAGGTITIDNATNNPNITFTQSAYIGYSAAATTWNRGTGTITFTGTNAQTFEGYNRTFESMVVNKASGTLTFSMWFQTINFTLDAGSVDFGDTGQTHTISGNATFNAGTLDLGTSIVAIGGNFDNRNLSTFTPATSTIRMTGNDKTFYSISDTPTTRRYYKLDFAAGCYTRLKGVNTVRALDRVDIAGRVHCEDVTLDVYNGGRVYFTSAGRVSGGVFSLTDCATGCGIVQFPAGATIDCTYLTFNCGWGGICSFPVGTYAAGQVEIRDTSGNAASHDVRLEAGSYVFTGAFVFSNSNPNGTLVMRNDVNNPNIEVRGNFTTTRTAGTLTWTAGTGTLTFAGGNAQSVVVSAGLGTLEAVNINKTANVVTLNSNMNLTHFTHTLGDVTFGAYTFSVGNFTLASGGTGTVTIPYNAPITISGNYSTVDSNCTYAISTAAPMTFSGTGKTMTFGTGQRYYLGAVTITGTYTLVGANQAYAFTSTTINAGAVLTLQDSYWIAENDFHLYGTVNGNSGNSRLYWYPTESDDVCVFYGGSILECYSFYARPLAAGITPTMRFEYAPYIRCLSAFYFWTGAEAYDRTVRMAGVGLDIYFECDVVMYLQSTANFTLDWSWYPTSSVQFQRDLSQIQVGGGHWFWNRGYEQIIISGSYDQTFDADGNTFSDFVVQKLGGGRFTVSVAGFTCKDLGFLGGDIDIRGAVIQCERSVSMDGWGGWVRFWNGTDHDMANARIHYTTGAWLMGYAQYPIDIVNLDFVNTVGATNMCTYLNITNSQRTGTGPDHDVSDGTSVDNGGNVGWDFGQIIDVAILTFHELRGAATHDTALVGLAGRDAEVMGLANATGELRSAVGHSADVAGVYGYSQNLRGDT